MESSPRKIVVSQYQEIDLSQITSPTTIVIRAASDEVTYEADVLELK